MDVQTITTLIGSLGFPIAACIACFSMLNKEREEHKQEMAKVTEAINNNTIALEALKGKLDRDG
jgi:starvation-inducible outer membrane lipoprotein